MAPEMTRGQLTEKVDVFAYGVVLMEIVTGRVTMSVTEYGSPFCLIDEVRLAWLATANCGQFKNMSRAFKHANPKCSFLMQMRELYKKAHESGREECLLRLVDRNLRNVYDKEEVIRVLKIALLCANDASTLRPPITQVVSMLLGTQTIPEYQLKSLLQSLQSSPSMANIELWDDFSNISPIRAGALNPSTSRSTSRVEADPMSKISVVDMEGR